MLATTLAFFAAWHLRFNSDLGGLIPFAVDDSPDFGQYLILLPIVLFVWSVVLYFHGLYQVKRPKNGVDESLTILVAVVLGTILLSVFTVWYRIPGNPRPDGSFEWFTYSRGFLAFFAGLDLAFLVVTRTLIRSYLKHIRLQGRSLQRILIAGAGALGKDVAQKLLAHQELGFDVVGFVDDDPGKGGRTFFDVPVIGRLDEIEAVIERDAIDQVYIALPLEAYRKTMRLLRAVGSECVDVKIVPDVLQYATLKAQFEDLDGTPVINLTQVPLRGWNSLVKRAMDVALALTAMLGLVPIFPLIALAIWLEDRGPIFYKQERMGLDGRSFWIWKLRSMRVNAEASSGPVWAIKDDPRRTRLGSFLRKWSIDELPQLWNVLKGEMSIVGPRPERPAFVQEFKGKLPQYMVRHRVKAGITGWAQVHGWRGNTSIKKRLQYDLYYIENWSLALDIKILWLTIRQGIRYNAY
jgi:exopolysaccharide biosynthesis polyprenyl glycosylphosphotransferase